MSNDNPYSENPQPNLPNAGIPGHPGPPPGMRQKSSFPVWAIVALAAVPVMCGCTGILVALLLPAVQSAREAARRMSCSNNMKQIGLALHNYHSSFGSFPPAYTVDDQGNPLHSWRTLILPYMEQQALYSSIDLSKPWDDPVNQLAASTVVAAYACPSSPDLGTRTTYVAVREPGSVFSSETPSSFREITDGTSNTLAVVEVSPDAAVPWMSPTDISLADFQATRGPEARHDHPGGGHVTMADGSVHFISETADSELIESLVTKDGDEESFLPQ